MFAVQAELDFRTFPIAMTSTREKSKRGPIQKPRECVVLTVEMRSSAARKYREKNIW